MEKVVHHRFRRLAILVALSLSLPGSDLMAQLSPGDLAEAHESLEGLTNCTLCHELGEGPKASKCLECHSNLASRIRAGMGYHDLVVNRQQKKCSACHSDHAGRDYQLIDWHGGMEDFDHNLSGYQLEGKHRDLPCRDCHNPAFISTKLRDHEPDIDITTTCLGLERACLSCHHDEHRKQLANDCLKCHSHTAFKPVDFFTHDSTRFRLSGKHRKVECVKCHPTLKDANGPKSSKTYIQYVDIEFKGCLSCHKDKHDNKFGTDCARCHTTRGWKKFQTAQFDHTQTAFPLKGRHKKVDCEKCHKGGSLLTKIAHNVCLDCHRDQHRGQFTHRNDKGKCESCHSVKRFVPALFTTADHDSSRFVLTDAHLAQPCDLCHTPLTDTDGKTYRRFVIEDRSCTGCHKDIHLDQFSATKPRKTCSDCHTGDSWQLVQFDHKALTRYPLEGAHKKVACSQCHAEIVSKKGTCIQYRGVDTHCRSCHANTQILGALE